MNDEDLPLGARLRASELLGKSERDFGESSVNVNVLSIADIFAKVRARRALPAPERGRMEGN